MNYTQKIDRIVEGKTEVLVFQNKLKRKGPGSKNKTPFYNPSMELNRDFSILFNQWFVNESQKRIFILDGLAASGIRGIRFANEIEGDFEVTINDWDENSYKLIKKNLLKIKKTRIRLNRI